MPSRNTLKQFIPDATYHIYNRGVAKLPIFLDKQDYQAYLRRLKLILLPLEQAEALQRTNDRIRLNNMHGQLTLQAYCLMPNHFHLLLKQYSDETIITRFMATLSTSYSMYFNRKYERVGPLFQGRFKAALVNNDTYLLHLSRYIHCNPRVLTEDIYHYSYSSLQFYFRPHESWLDTSEQEALFSSAKEYFSFIDDLQDVANAAELYDL